MSAFGSYIEIVSDKSGGSSEYVCDRWKSKAPCRLFSKLTSTKKFAQRSLPCPLESVKYSEDQETYLRNCLRAV